MAVGMLLVACEESGRRTTGAAGSGTTTERAVSVGTPEAVRYQGQGVEREVGRERVPRVVESVGRRMALVIGNAAYEEPGSGLTNPVRDAEAMAEILREVDFEVIVAVDATLEGMERAANDFIRELRSGDAAVFYYSGHGLEQGGENYLVPVDFSAAYYEDEVLLRRRTLVASEVQERMEAAGARVRIMILDACRSSPFDFNGKSMGRGGLAAMAPRGGLVAFAAEAGRVASDNRDEMNGLFTKHLVAALREPGLAARDVFARVHESVRAESGARQAPATYDAGAGGFVFRPGPVAPPILPAVEHDLGGRPVLPAPPTENLFWQSIAESEDPADFEDYLRQFADGTFARMARRRMEALLADVADVVPPLRWRDGEEFRDCANCPEMVVVPAGRFRMGCVSGRDCQGNEQPVHEVRVASFALSKYEVTFAEYDRFVRATGGPRPDDERWGRDRRPVIHVSWEDAFAYAAWLSEDTGAAYRLPSEAEWEYAARAGTTTRYSWGEEIGRNRANCNGCGSLWDGDGTAPVGSFAANTWGLHDMLGNVWEWVVDCWHGDYDGVPLDGSAWTNGGDCSLRVLRGGSWDFNPALLRSALRITIAAGLQDDDVGFRLARTLD